MEEPHSALFEQYLDEYSRLDFSGWDFSSFKERWQSDEPPWDYLTLANDKTLNAGCVLDMGTGGGEALSSLTNLPPVTVATESYLPNVRVAAGRLLPLGIALVRVEPDENPLPFANATFDLVLNRHESFHAAEVYRILQPGGRFLTQQVGGQDNFRLNELLQDQPHIVYADWTPERACAELEQAGFSILTCLQAFPRSHFSDLGAVLCYLKIISWQIDDFNIEKYRPRLLKLHQQMLAQGGLETTQHRFLIEAVKL